MAALTKLTSVKRAVLGEVKNAIENPWRGKLAATIGQSQNTGRCRVAEYISACQGVGRTPQHVSLTRGDAWP